MAFLSTVAQALLERHHRLDDIAVVLPSHRAGLHLRKYLAQASGKPLWSPVLFEPSGFLAEVAGLRPLEPVEALLLLHECHASLMGDRAEPLEEFLQWAPATLRDMSEVDAHLIDHNALYRELNAYHEIEAWSFLGTEALSRSQQQASERWRHMGQLHRLFAEKCAESGCGTYGSIARAASSRLLSGELTLPWRAIWFVGLNAMDPALKQVAHQLGKSGIGYCAWDADRFYADHPDHEAGRFLRESMRTLGAGVVQRGNAIEERSRRIESITVADRAAMVRHAAAWAMDLDQAGRESAVIVLADESLLMLLLEALPSAIGPLNVTMGIAMGALPMLGLERACMKLLERHMTDGFLDRKELEMLLGHPLIHEGDSTRKLLRELPDSEVTAVALLAAAEEAGHGCMVQLEAVFAPADTDRFLSSRMRALHAWVLTNHASDALIREQVFTLAKAAQALDRHLDGLTGARISPAAYCMLRERMTRQLRLSIFGEPLSGLQIMGVLETRALDHDQVLVLGAQEGVLAGGDAAQSWIPFDIRKRWGLPLPADADAITSYHVHRLLHQAQRVTLVHATGDQDKGPSRFIAQWRHAFGESSRTRVEERTVLAPVIAHPKRELQVAKTTEALSIIHAMAGKGFSPTVLGHWLSCPMDFHARHILGIKEVPEFPGRLAPNDVGSAVHKVLEEALNPAVGRKLAADDLAFEPGELHVQLTTRLVRAGFSEKSLSTGFNRLLLEMAASALERYLRFEARRCATEETTVMALEQRASVELGEGIRLTGIIDRIDRRDGVLHVLDIKTGGINEKDLKIDLADGTSLEHGQNIVLQLMCYAILCFRAQPDLDSLKAGLIPLRRAGQAGEAWLKIDGNEVIHRSVLAQLESLVQRIALEILDPDLPFAHEARARNCLACLYD